MWCVIGWEIVDRWLWQMVKMIVCAEEGTWVIAGVVDLTNIWHHIGKAQSNFVSWRLCHVLLTSRSMPNTLWETNCTCTHKNTHMKRFTQDKRVVWPTLEEEVALTRRQTSKLKIEPEHALAEIWRAKPSEILHERTRRSYWTKINKDAQVLQRN